MRVAFHTVAGIRTRTICASRAGPLHRPPVVLLHGFGLSADVWLRNVDRLGTDRAAFAPDMVGHGRTEPMPGSVGPPETLMITHLLSWLDAIGIEDFDLVGSSFGAQISVLLYFELRDRIRHLVLVGSRSCFSPFYTDGCDDGFRPENSLIEMVHDPTTVPGSLVRRDRRYREMSAAAWRARASEMSRQGHVASRVAARLAEISLPTLVIWGRHDRRSWQWGREGTGRLPQGRFVVIEQSGHLPYLERPRVFNAVVRRFFDDCSARLNLRNDCRRRI